MEYSNFSLDQLMEVYGYQELCDCFLSLAKDDETKAKLESILYQGGYQNYKLSSGRMGIDGPIVDIKRRAAIANLILTNPETFDELARRNIKYFHGTNDEMAVNRTLYYGLTSADELKNMGINATSGENPDKGRKYTSVTDVLDTAEEYATMNNRYSSGKPFQAVVGLPEDSIEQNKERVYRVTDTSLPEIGIKPPFPPKFIGCILVPSDKVEYVRRMAQTQSYLPILAHDGMLDKFYEVKIDGGIEIDYNKYEEFKSKYGQKYGTR